MHSLLARAVLTGSGQHMPGLPRRRVLERQRSQRMSGMRLRALVAWERIRLPILRQGQVLTGQSQRLFWLSCGEFRRRGRRGQMHAMQCRHVRTGNREPGMHSLPSGEVCALGGEHLHGLSGWHLCPDGWGHPMRELC